MSKQLSPELQKVYNWCNFQMENLDKSAEKTDDLLVAQYFTTQSTCYWNVKQFIEVNFLEE